MNSLCLVLDGLHSGYVGAYGNSWIETPSLDRLATEAFLLDQYWLDSPRLDLLYRSHWLGRHALEPHEEESPQNALAAMISSRGVATTLASDEADVLSHRLGQGFQQRLALPTVAAMGPAGAWDETHLARCFAELVDWLEKAAEPLLLWCHLGSLTRTWDAPYALRAQYAADEDPPPPEGAEVPSLVLEEDYDPDRLLGITQSYAGQVTLLDTCLGALLDWLDESEVGKATQLTLMAGRGFPLGEHLHVGGNSVGYGELLHVPVMLRFPDGAGAAARSGALIEPADVWATLLDWWEIGNRPGWGRGRSLLPLVRDEVDQVRDRLCIGAPGDSAAIVTPAWYGRFGEEPELYLKPDDRWEFNDVSRRCPEIVELLESALGAGREGILSRRADDLEPLEPRLVYGVE